MGENGGKNDRLRALLKEIACCFWEEYEFRENEPATMTARLLIEAEELIGGEHDCVN
jgi:hypothetical protein